MRKICLLCLLIALLFLIQKADASSVESANWDFDHSYDQSSVNDTVVKRTKYEYKVQAVNKHGTLSEYSNTITLDGSGVDVSNSNLHIKNVRNGSTLCLFSMNRQIMINDKTSVQVYSKNVPQTRNLYFDN